jgi:hypothetical protein
MSPRRNRLISKVKGLLRCKHYTLSVTVMTMLCDDLVWLQSENLSITLFV